LPHNFLATD